MRTITLPRWGAGGWWWEGSEEGIGQFQTALCNQSLQLESPMLGSGLGGQLEGNTDTASAARSVGDVPADLRYDHRQVLHLTKTQSHQLQNGDANYSLLTFL